MFTIWNGCHSTEGQAIMHCRVRNYLRIDQDIMINFDCVYSNNNIFNLSKGTTVSLANVVLK